MISVVECRSTITFQFSLSKVHDQYVGILAVKFINIVTFQFMIKTVTFFTLLIITRSDENS